MSALLEDRHRHLGRDADRVLAGARFDEDPRHALALLAKAGLLRACVPAAYGGLRDRVELRDLVVLRMRIAHASALADTMFAMQGLGSYPVTAFGRDDQRQSLLPRAADGSCICAFAITEPEAGSDVASMRSRATREGDAYVVSGEKVFISNAGIADRYVLFARTSDDRKRGISAFLVEGDRPGLAVEPMRVLGDHPVGRVRMDGLRLPVSARLGEEGDGLGIAFSALDFFRTTVGAAATGMARRALDEARARVKARVQFGKTLAEQQATQLAIAEMALDVAAARLLCLDAAWIIDCDTSAGAAQRAQKAAMAKLFATEAAQRVVDRALQLWGGAGLVEGAVVERLYREVRSLRIYEGTSEIQKLVIARAELA